MNDSVKVTNAEMVQYVTNAIDTWAETLGEILTMLDEVVDSTNGEFVANNLVEKINYIEETKELIRLAINDAGSNLGTEVPFRKYPEYIKGIPLVQFTPKITYAIRYPKRIRIGVPYGNMVFTAPSISLAIKRAKKKTINVPTTYEQTIQVGIQKGNL